MLQFMGDHPILTFFLAIIAGDTVVKSFRAIFGRKKKVKPTMVISGRE